jgi:hypothetical protein
VKAKIILPVAVLAGCASPSVPEYQGPPMELAGRHAGAPQPCVPLRNGEALRVSETNRNTVVYGDGKVIWANFLGQCRFSQNDLLVTLPSAGNYCRGDPIHSVDQGGGLPGPTCILGNFVPYTY